MNLLNIENLTKEVIREILLERHFARKQETTNVVKQEVDDAELEDLKVQLGISPSAPKLTNRLSYTWQNSNRKTLLDISVGGVEYFRYPRNIRRSVFRQKWLRARHSLRRLYGADFAFTETMTSLRVERIA